MNQGIVVAVITICGSILTATASYLVTQRHAWKVRWQREKLNHYRVLISSLSNILADASGNRGDLERFSLAFNTIGLVAPLKCSPKTGRGVKVDSLPNRRRTHHGRDTTTVQRGV